MLKKIRNSIQFFIVLLSVGVIYLTCYILHQEKHLEEGEMLHLGPYSVGHVISDSMSPLLCSGDTVFLREEDVYEEGDIIVFEHDSLLIIHRIVDVLGNNNYQTKGDANAVEDPFIVNIAAIKGTLFKIW